MVGTIKFGEYGTLSIIKAKGQMPDQDKIEMLTAEVESLHQQLSQMQGVESQRREAQDRYSGILDIAHEGIISVDEAQQILVFNHGAEIIFGYTSDEVLGKPLSADGHAYGHLFFRRLGVLFLPSPYWPCPAWYPWPRSASGRLER